MLKKRKKVVRDNNLIVSYLIGKISKEDEKIFKKMFRSSEEFAIRTIFIGIGLDLFVRR